MVPFYLVGVGSPRSLRTFASLSSSAVASGSKDLWAAEPYPQTLAALPSGTRIQAEDIHFQSVHIVNPMESGFLDTCSPSRRL